MIKDPISKEQLHKQLMRVKKQGWMPHFDAASAKSNLAIEVLLAVASRETNCSNIVGDKGHGRGIMQIDDRSHMEFISINGNGMVPESNIRFGASLIRAYLDYYKNNIEAAIAAYNTGQKNVNNSIKAGRSVDSTTTEKNYSEDVLYRSKLIKELLQAGNYGQIIEKN